MSTTQIIIIGAYACILLVWVARHFVISMTYRATPLLSPCHPRYQDPHPPLVSVLVPAKDEEKSIATCVRSILNQNYTNLEVLVIDDRSTDRTPDVVRELAALDSRVRLISVKTLPPGWTGKNNALTLGVREAKGEWLLFVDSDTEHSPENLSVLTEYARREQAEMVSVLPRWRNDSFWERVAQPLAALLLILKSPPHRVNNDADTGTAFANGQYILIRRDTYGAIGGHTCVRDKFVEDIHLARVAKTAGHRVRLVRAPELTSTRMYTSLRSLVSGWSRILYSGYDLSVLQLTVLLGGLLVFSLSAYGVLAVTASSMALGHSTVFVRALLGMSLTHVALQFTVMARIYAITASQKAYVVFYGLAAMVMAWVLISALFKCFTHRIVWRGTDYYHLQEQEPVILRMPNMDLVRPIDRPLSQSA